MRKISRLFFEPCAQISTLPSGRLRAKPVNFKREAIDLAVARKPTPCTRPITTAFSSSIHTPHSPFLLHEKNRSHAKNNFECMLGFQKCFYNDSEHLGGCERLFPF